MRRYIDKNDKENEIRLLFRHPLYKEKVIVVVEGRSDIKLFRNLLDSSCIGLESFDGKIPLLEAMESLVVEFPNRIFAVCDADYSHLNAESDRFEDFSVFLTDYHDAEMMLVNSASLLKYVDEYSRHDAFEYLRENLFRTVMDAAYPIGILRWLNCNEELNLRFEGLNFNHFISIDEMSASIDEDKLIESVMDKSNNRKPHVTVEYLRRSMEELKRREENHLQVNCGHDVTKIISLIYQSRRASVERNMDQRKVESALRIGYGKEDFFCSSLYNKLNEAFSRSGLSGAICGQ